MNKDIQNFKKRLQTFAKDLQQVDDRFDTFAKQAVELYWQHMNVTPANQLLEVSKLVKGLNRRALSTYLKKYIGHKMSKGQFTKKDEARFDEAKASFEAEFAADTWTNYNIAREAKPYNFSVGAVVSLVGKRLDKALDEGQLSVEQLQALREGINKKIAGKELRIQGRHGDKAPAKLQEAVA